MQAPLRPTRAHTVRRLRHLPVLCLSAVLTAATLVACAGEKDGETTELVVDPDAVFAAFREADSGVDGLAYSGPWHAADDILVAALEPSLVSTARVVSQALEQAMPSVRATVWIPGNAPAPPGHADVVATLVRATDEDGQRADGIHLEVNSRLGLLQGAGSSPCDFGDTSLPERRLPVVTFDSSTNVSHTGKAMKDGLAIAAAIYGTLESAAENTIALPDPPTTAGLPLFPVPTPPLAEMVALVAGQQPLGVSEALWFMPSDAPITAMAGAAVAAKRAGWTLADRYAGRALPAVAHFSRRGGCLAIARRDTHIWAHALSSDPESDAATLLAPMFEAQLHTAPIADLMPYIRLALPEQRRRFFDRVIAERPTDDASLLALADHLHEERDDDDAAANYLEPVARHAWRLESDVAANAINLVDSIGLVNLYRKPGHIADWEHYGYEVIEPGHERVREVGLRESLALIVEGNDGFSAVTVQVRRQRVLPADPMAYELFVDDRWLGGRSDGFSSRSSASLLRSTRASSVRLQLLVDGNWVLAEARQVGPERFELRVRVDAEGELTTDDGG